MTGIRELFAELSEPDYYDVSAQLELFLWREMRAQRERQARYRFAIKCDPMRRTHQEELPARMGTQAEATQASEQGTQSQVAHAKERDGDVFSLLQTASRRKGHVRAAPGSRAPAWSPAGKEGRMTRNYMRSWRTNWILANDPCECGNFPRVGYDRGCKRCEGMDVERYKAERLVALVRRKLPRYDLVSAAEMAADCGTTIEQAGVTLRHLVECGEAETVGLSNTMEYRMKRRAA